MELKDLVLGKKYKINKPDEIDQYPYWADDMDRFSDLEITYGEELTLQWGQLVIGETYAVTWEICPTWLTEVCEDAPEKEFNTQLPEVRVTTPIPEVKPPKTPVKSDGGSSDYYKLKMRLSSDQIKTVENHPELTDVTFETGDIIRALVENDFDLGNIIKAIRRIHQAKKGEGKQGVSVEYDCKKIDYFLKEWYDNYQKEQI